MVGQAPMRLQNMVSDIQDKYRDIKKLEQVVALEVVKTKIPCQSVNMVHQMFVDMALLVHHQGEMIDNIEINIGAANNYVEKANVKLNKAKKSHMSARKVN